MRGLAVLVMIEAHVVDSWTRVADRTGAAFQNAMMVGGFGAPLFLFLAGAAAILAAASRQRRFGSAALAAAATRRRGWEIFGLAFLFRFQAYLLSPGATLRGILRVDILNVMGPSIVAAATIWQCARTGRNRALAFVGAIGLLAMMTPIVRSTGVLEPLPDPLESYIRPSAMSTFTLFPWAGFVMAGALVGLFIGSADERLSEARLMGWFVAAGIALVVGGYAASLAPAIYANSSFWTSSPTFFFLRTGVLIVLTASAWWWRRPGWSGGAPAKSPLEVFGRSSLFVYWIHVEMVYGVLSWPLHKRLSLAGSLVACLMFSLFLYALVLKNRFLTRPRATRESIPERLPNT
jgi:uncharacterized membrane protein